MPSSGANRKVDIEGYVGDNIYIQLENNNE